MLFLERGRLRIFYFCYPFVLSFNLLNNGIKCGVGREESFFFMNEKAVIV